MTVVNYVVLHEPTVSYTCNNRHDRLIIKHKEFNLNVYLIIYYYYTLTYSCRGDMASDMTQRYTRFDSGFQDFQVNLHRLLP